MNILRTQHTGKTLSRPKYLYVIQNFLAVSSVDRDGVIFEWLVEGNLLKVLNFTVIQGMEKVWINVLSTLGKEYKFSHSLSTIGNFLREPSSVQDAEIDFMVRALGSIK